MASTLFKLTPAALQILLTAGSKNEAWSFWELFSASTTISSSILKLTDAVSNAVLILRIVVNTYVYDC
jgi:hypothetical protein